MSLKTKKGYIFDRTDQTSRAAIVDCSNKPSVTAGTKHLPIENNYSLALNAKGLIFIMILKTLQKPSCLTQQIVPEGKDSAINDINLNQITGSLGLTP